MALREGRDVDAEPVQGRRRDAEADHESRTVQRLWWLGARPPPLPGGATQSAPDGSNPFTGGGSSVSSSNATPATRPPARDPPADTVVVLVAIVVAIVLLVSGGASSSGYQVRAVSTTAPSWSQGSR